jgi:opacity protein-like surface antigen
VNYITIFKNIIRSLFNCNNKFEKNNLTIFMKKIILSAIMLFGLAFTAQSQEISKHALGLRLGDNNGFGGEVSYQLGLNQKNRLEFDLGWRNSRDVDAVKGVALYQWVWNIDGGFNWYAGVGGGLAAWDYDYRFNDNRYKDSGTYVFAAGDIGIEYRFKEIPLTLSLDGRPEIGSGYYDDDNFGFDVGLGVKFRF